MDYVEKLQKTVPDEVLIGLVILCALAVGFVAAGLVLSLLSRIIKRSKALSLFVKCERLRAPVYTAVPILTVFIALRLTFPEALRYPFFAGMVKITSVLLLYWLAMRIIEVVASAISKRYDITVRDNLRAREVRTRIIVIRGIVTFLVFLAATVAMFLQFEELRTLGVSLLASAGIAGIILGFAAQKTLGNLLAGITIALSQPVRIDDVVVVEGEWGRIEEINLVFVTVKLWDLRRLVLPISYLLEHPFQNWTRTSADLIGEVNLYADYTLPLEPLRDKLKAILAATPLWDGNTQVVQVTECEKEAMKIRILVSAGDSANAWDLRCLVREQMIAFIQEKYPQCLPRQRAELAGAISGDTVH